MRAPRSTSFHSANCLQFRWQTLRNYRNRLNIRIHLSTPLQIRKRCHLPIDTRPSLPPSLIPPSIHLSILLFCILLCLPANMFVLLLLPLSLSNHHQSFLFILFLCCCPDTFFNSCQFCLSLTSPTCRYKQLSAGSVKSQQLQPSPLKECTNHLQMNEVQRLHLNASPSNVIKRCPNKQLELIAISIANLSPTVH